MLINKIKNESQSKKQINERLLFIPYGCTDPKE